MRLDKFPIVLAKIEKVLTPVPGTGRPDFGIGPELEEETHIVRSVWCLYGTNHDLKKVEQFAKDNGFLVFFGHGPYDTIDDVWRRAGRIGN